MGPAWSQKLRQAEHRWLQLNERQRPWSERRPPPRPGAALLRDGGAGCGSPKTTSRAWDAASFPPLEATRETSPGLQRRGWHRWGRHPQLCPFQMPPGLSREQTPILWLGARVGWEGERSSSLGKCRVPSRPCQAKQATLLGLRAAKKKKKQPKNCFPPLPC